MIDRLGATLMPSRHHDSLSEHRAILVALRAGDGEASSAAMERHIDAVRRSLHLLR